MKMTNIIREDINEEYIGDEEKEPSEGEWESMDEEFNLEMLRRWCWMNRAYVVHGEK
jgi:hypothetical protein